MLVRTLPLLGDSFRKTLCFEVWLLVLFLINHCLSHLISISSLRALHGSKYICLYSDVFFSPDCPIFEETATIVPARADCTVHSKPSIVTSSLKSVGIFLPVRS